MKKTLNIIKNVFVWLVVALAVAMMIFTVVSVNTFDKDNRDIFGYKALIVKSDSMSAVKDNPEHKGYFDAGDLIFIKEVDASTLKEGDIISYSSTNTENFGETVTHMIRRVTPDGFVTYGTTTDTDDANIVESAYVLGKYKGHIANVGNFFNFLKTTPGYMVCIFLPFLLLIVIQGFNSIKLFRRYKQEQMAEVEAKRQQELAELQAEREKIEEERRKQEEMMQQLLQMQAAMQGGAPAEDSQSADASESDGE